MSLSICFLSSSKSNSGHIVAQTKDYISQGPLKLGVAKWLSSTEGPVAAPCL